MARRRRKARHGDGSYRKRGPNSWELRWMVRGIAHSETVHGAEDDARARLKRVTAEHAEGAPAAGLMQRTVGDVIRWQLEHYERERPASLASIESYARRLLASDLAAVRVVRLRKAHLDKLEADLLADGLSPGSVNRFTGLLVAAFRRAAAEDPPLVTRVPHVKRLKEANIRQGFLLPEDYDRLMNHIGPEWLQLMFAIGYHVGARAGSILATRWEQVDWKRKIIRPPANQPRNKKVGYWPVYGDLEHRLRKAELRREEFWPHVPWLIHKNGRRLRRAVDYHREWTRAVKLAGLDGLLFHDLRRTAARNLLASGADAVAVCRIVGWESERMLHRYRILDELDAARIGERAERYLESLQEGRAKAGETVQ